MLLVGSVKSVRCWLFLSRFASQWLGLYERVRGRCFCYESIRYYYYAFGNLILALVNALAAFAMAVALDAGFSWPVSQTGNCR